MTISIATNSMITCAKLFGFLSTGSPTLFAETIHSTTDVINQVLLKVGEVKAGRRPTRKHPFGFGKEKYFWALVSSISVLFLGCGVSIRHAIEALRHPEPPEPFSALAIGLLILAGLLESYTFHVAWKEIGGWPGLKRAGANTTVLAVLLEDAVALLGIALALFVAFWSVAAGPSPTLDAWVSILIGLLLGAMALALARLNKELLIDVADTDLDARIERAVQEKAGIKVKVATTMIDSDHCLLYVQVAQSDVPADFSLAKMSEAGELLKQHVSVAMGKTIDHVFWRFSPGGEIRET